MSSGQDGLSHIVVGCQRELERRQWLGCGRLLGGQSKQVERWQSGGVSLLSSFSAHPSGGLSFTQNPLTPPTEHLSYVFNVNTKRNILLGGYQLRFPCQL